MTLWVDERFAYVMVFTGDTLEAGDRRPALAVEPMSCPPDAFRSGTSTRRAATRWPVDRPGASRPAEEGLRGRERGPTPVSI